MAGGPGSPSMSSGLLRSIRRIRPLKRAKTRTLLAAWPATKSAAMENCNCTGKTSKMGSAASARSATPSTATKPLDGSSAIVKFGL
jgi:hypothetical protein